MDKEIVIKIVTVLNSLIYELYPQMGEHHTKKLYDIIDEIEQMVEEQKEGE